LFSDPVLPGLVESDAGDRVVQVDPIRGKSELNDLPSSLVVVFEIR